MTEPEYTSEMTEALTQCIIALKDLKPIQALEILSAIQLGMIRSQTFGKL